MKSLVFLVLTLFLSVSLSDVYDDCGTFKSCIATPENCIESKDCSIMTTFRNLTTQLLEIEIYGQISGDEYVAFGISDDAKMGTDSVTECVQYKNTIRAYQSYNIPGDDNNKRLTSNLAGFQLINSTYADGYIYCQMQHPIVFINSGVSFDLSKRYYLLMAKGPADAGNIKEHDTAISTDSPSSLADDPPFISYFKESRALKELHGSFMVVSWLIAASIGILMPRYMKKSWVGKQILGKDRWFVYHQGLMGIAWLLTMAGFIIIFVDVGGWVPETVSENPHPLIGCITTVLAFIQPIMAAFRPSPDSSKRYIFNWAHTFVGYSAHILAITTIFLAVEMPDAGLPYETYWLLTAHLVSYVTAQCILTALALRKKKPDPKDVLDYSFRNTVGRDSLIRKTIIGIFACIAVGLGTTVVVFVAQVS